MDRLELLAKRIEELREKLHTAAQGSLLTDPDVVNLDEEMNRAINEYYRLVKQK